MKVVVTGYDGDQPIYNTRFLAFATYYGFQPWACRPHRPQTKGKIERPFLYISQNLLNGRTFTSLEHLNEVTAQWLAQTADVRFHQEIKARPIDRFQEEKPHLLSLPARAYDTAQVLYRTVNSEGQVMYRQNFYSVPWQRIGELLPLRITEKELIVYGADVREIARHELYASGISGEKRSLPEHAPGRDHQQKYELLKERFAEFGAHGVRFFDELIRTRRCGKNEAARVLGLLAIYHRDDLARALERAVRYRAYSWSAVERILATQARPRSVWESLEAEAQEQLDEIFRQSPYRFVPRQSIRHCWKKRLLAMKQKTKTTTTKITMPKVTTPLREQCLSHCATLGIPLAPATLDELLSRAEKEGLPHLQFLDLLLGAEAHARRERGVARRIREAHFAEEKVLEGFDWQFNAEAFDRVQIEELATGDFIRRRANLIMVGWSGIGKSHIIQAVGQKACVHGYRVLYRTSAELLSDLTASLADKTLPARLRRYASPDLLIIDEFGFDRIERVECPEAAHLLYKIIAARNQKRSTAVVTNVDFEKWGEYLPDGPLAMAFLDRLVERAIILKVTGKSYRAWLAQQAAEAEAAKKVSK
jgi:DNA replication protein DnaC